MRSVTFQEKRGSLTSSLNSPNKEGQLVKCTGAQPLLLETKYTVVVSLFNVGHDRHSCAFGSTTKYEIDIISTTCLIISLLLYNHNRGIGVCVLHLRLRQGQPVESGRPRGAGAGIYLGPQFRVKLNESPIGSFVRG